MVNNKTEFISRDTIYEVTQSLWKSKIGSLGQNLRLKDAIFAEALQGLLSSPIDINRDINRDISFESQAS